MICFLFFSIDTLLTAFKIGPLTADRILHMSSFMNDAPDQKKTVHELFDAFLFDFDLRELGNDRKYLCFLCEDQEEVYLFPNKSMDVGIIY